MEKMHGGEVTDIDFPNGFIRLEVRRGDVCRFIDIEPRNFPIAVGHLVYWRALTLWWHPRGPFTVAANSFRLIRCGNG